MWDIHGNPLKKGHCEVHPYIAEEYPCHVCQEQQRVANIHQQAREIVDYEAPLLEKMIQARQMATLTADQYTVNLLGYVHNDIEQMLNENKRLREALEFYANESNNRHKYDFKLYQWDLLSKVAQDEGQIARQALEGEQHDPSTD